MQDIASTGVTLLRSSSSGDLVLNVTATGNTVTIGSALQPGGATLAIGFADGVIWRQDQVEQMLLDQASAAIGGSVYGYYGKDDTIVACLGNKYRAGLGGNDTYVYSSAGGNDYVDDSGATLVMQDIASTGVTLSRSGGSSDLLISVTATRKTVTGGGALVSSYGPLAINFSVGVSWNQAQVEQMLLDQESATNGGSICGYYGKDDTPVASLGNKYLNGLSGNDTYIYVSRG